MALKGDLNNVNLGDIFQTLAMNLQEGVLVISQENRAKRIYFKDGRIALLASRNKRGFRLGDRLISLGRLSPEDLNMALRQHETAGNPLGEVLVTMNLASREDIDDTLTFQAEEEIYELFTWRNAHFEFIEGPPRERASDNIEIAQIFFNVSNIIMEAARRMDEWIVIRQDIPSLDEIFVRNPEADSYAATSENELDWISQKVLKLIDGKRSVHDLSEETCYSSFDLAKIICGFLHEGRICPAAAEELEMSLAVLIRDKEFNRALTVLKKLIESEQGNINYLMQAADLSHRIGRFEDASYYYAELARFHEAELDLVSAEKYLRRAVKLDLRNEQIHESLLRILAENGDWDQYVEHSLKAADLASKAGAHQRAREILERAAAERPDDVQLVSQLSSVYVKLNRKDEAVGLLQSLLEHLNPKRDRKKIELIGEKIIKLGYRDPNVVKLLQTAKTSRKRSNKRRFVMVASILPALALGSYLYKGYHEQKQATALLTGAQQAWDKGEIWRAKELLEKLTKRDPNRRYCPEGPDLAEKVQDAIDKQLHDDEKSKDKENERLFEAAAGRLETGDFAGAIEQYAKLSKKNAAGPWHKNVSSRIDVVKERLYATLERLEKARKDVAKQAQTGNSVDILQSYDRLLKDPVRNSVMELSLKLADLDRRGIAFAKAAELKQPINSIIKYFEEVYKERSVHREVTRREALLRFVNAEFIAATEAFSMGDLEAATKHLRAILDSSYNRQPRKEIQEFLKRVKGILEIVEQTKNPQEIKQLDEVFEKVRKLLVRYPQLDQTMKLPLQIRTIPGGARVYMGGILVGKTSPSINLTYQRSTVETIRIEKEGFAPLTRSLEKNTDWLWEITLTRDVVRSWQVAGSAEAAPTHDGHYVYVPCRDGIVYVVDPAEDDFVHEIDTKSIGGCHASVAFDREAIYFPDREGHLRAYERGTWTMLWRLDLKDRMYGAVAVADGELYVGTERGHVRRIEAATGQQEWSFKAKDQVRGTPVVRGDRVYATSYDRHLYAINRDDGTLLWRFKADEIIEAAPVVAADGTIYVLDKWRFLYAIKPSGDLLWRARVGGSASAPTVVDNSLFVASDNRVVHRLHPTDGSELGTYRTLGTLSSSPLVKEGTVYQCSRDSHIWAFDVRSGEVNWRYLTGGPITTSPLIFGNHIFVVSSDRRLYMFKR